MSIKTLTGLAIAGTILSSTSVLAEENVLQSHEVVVTAAKVSQTLEDTLAPVTIITRDNIEKSQARDIRDIFRNIPSMSIVNSGGLGKSTDVYLRGTESTHVLVLIDGVRVGSATSGSTSFQHLPLSQIERIEVVRGPRASLYGSGAIGGVIQIFTRKGGAEGVKNYGSVGGGTHGTFEADAGFSGSEGTTKFSLNLGSKQSQGFDARTSGSDDKDGYVQKSIFGNLSHGFENGLEVETNLSAVKAETDFDGTPDSTNSDQRIFSLKANKDVMESWNTAVNVSRNWDLTRNYSAGTYYSTFDTVRDNVTWQNNLYLNDENTLITGLDYQYDTIESSGTYTETERYNAAAFAQYILDLGDHNIQTSLRFDENEQFGDNTTGSVAWGYPIHENIDVLASYATAFKAPTFNQLYSSAGSSVLNPESSKSYEIGLRGHHESSKWAFYVFQTDVDDLISYSSATTQFENISKADLKGAELEGSIQLGDFDIASNVSYVKALNKSDGSNYGNLLRRRAKWRGNLNTAYQLNEDLRLGADVHYVGYSFNNTSNSTKMKPHTTLDLKANYNIVPNWSLELSGNNMFDRVYETVDTYYQDRRNFFLRLRYSLD